MTDWSELLQRPPQLAAPGVVETWFTAIADRLLNGVRLHAGGLAHRLVEIEFYLRDAEHRDPFTHGDPLQLQCDRWYFHRTGGVYRGGSFKGLDLTFGDGTQYGGVLFRGLETDDGTLIDGPSLCVDYLLKLTKTATVRELDARLVGRLAWDASNPLSLVETEPRKQPLFRSARVGLTLKNTRLPSEASRFVLLPYRYLTEPRRIAKGKALLALAMYARGASVEEIHQATGCPRKSVQRYIEAFEAGRGATDFSAYVGVELKPGELCRLHGTWCRVYSS